MCRNDVINVADNSVSSCAAHEFCLSVYLQCLIPSLVLSLRGLPWQKCLQFFLFGHSLSSYSMLLSISNASSPHWYFLQGVYHGRNVSSFSCLGTPSQHTQFFVYQLFFFTYPHSVQPTVDLPYTASPSVLSSYIL